MSISASRVTRFGLGGGIWSPAGDFSTKEPGIISNSDYVAAAYFTTSSTVTIEVWNSITGNSESLTSNNCTEIGTTGVFIWDSSKLATQPHKYQQYVWKMTDGTNSESGIMEVPGDKLYWSLYRPLLRTGSER